MRENEGDQVVVVLALNLIGWESSGSFQDQSQSKVTQKRINLWLFNLCITLIVALSEKILSLTSQLIVPLIASSGVYPLHSIRYLKWTSGFITSVESTKIYLGAMISVWTLLDLSFLFHTFAAQDQQREGYFQSRIFCYSNRTKQKSFRNFRCCLQDLFPHCVWRTLPWEVVTRIPKVLMQHTSWTTFPCQREVVNARLTDQQHCFQAHTPEWHLTQFDYVPKYDSNEWK